MSTVSGPTPGPECGRPADGSLDSTSGVHRGRSSDPSTLRTLIGLAMPSVRRWARGRVPHYARRDANTEDVLQDAVLQTLKHLPGVRHRTLAGLEAYLRTGVLNRIRDLIRGTARRGVPIELSDTLRDDSPSPMEIAIKQQQMAQFLEALARLKPADRQLVVWRLQLGYSADEIATKLGKSKAAAAMSVTRAVSRLARELGLSRQ